ncbi:MAG: hypothetical protein HKN59_04710 [Gammaproteobacteria bacterium]|nr:hypothetical protein [Gammaproteobacteria bacterium]
MTAASLNGLRVLVTRPRDRARQFAQALADAGGDAIIFPAVEIRARANEQVRADLAKLADGQSPLIIFVSGPSVTHGLQTVTEIFGEPGILSVAAVGSHTATMLTAAGCKGVIAPQSGNGSEALLEALSDIDVAGRQVVILRGESGREKLAEDLASRGARVSMVSVYERRRPAMDPGVAETRLLKGEIDAVTVTSAGIFENLLALLSDEARECLRNTPLLVPSERVVTMVRAHGATGDVIVAEGADDAAMLAALAGWRRDNPATVGTEDIAMSEDKQPGKGASADKPEGESPGSNAGAAVESSKDAAGEKSAEKSKAEKKPDTAPTAPAAKKPFEDPGKKKVAKQKSGRGLAALALLLALVACAGSGYLWWMEREAGRGTENMASSFEQSTAALRAGMQSDLDALRSNVASLDDQFADMIIDQEDARLALGGIDNLNARLQDLASEVEGMRGVSNSAKRSWAIAEAAYFLQAANTSLQLGRNVDAASNALAAADDRLASLGEPALLPVRQAIAGELQSLRALPDTDVTGIALTLGRLAADAGNLATHADRPEAYATADQAAESESPEQGLARAKRVLGDAMKSMITVRRTDQQATALLAPEEEFFLARNLELQLLTARLALLREEPELFAQSVETSLTWLRSFFDSEDPAVAATITTLEGMRATAVRRTMPDISASLTLLRGMQDESQ